MTDQVLVIIGPTASGKSALALQAAEQFSGEIVTADSMQVYRGMDIGTAKPSLAEQDAVRHHMIDITEPSEKYSVGRYQTEARAVIADIRRRGKLPILAGGSGLYIHAITHDLQLGDRPGADEKLRAMAAEMTDAQLYKELQDKDPQSAARIHPHDRRRLLRALEMAQTGGRLPYRFLDPADHYDFVITGLTMPREELYARINQRVDRMMEAGLPEEVRGLLERFTPDCTAMQAIGYKETAAYLHGQIGSIDEASELIKKNTRHFAKRQMTWFRREARTEWMDALEDPAVLLARLSERIRP